MLRGPACIPWGGFLERWVRWSHRDTLKINAGNSVPGLERLKNLETFPFQSSETPTSSALPQDKAPLTLTGSKQWAAPIDFDWLQAPAQARCYEVR